MNWITDIADNAVEFINAGDYLGYSTTGDKFANQEVNDLELKLDGDIIDAEYDGTIYYFAPDSTEIQINAHVEKFWPSSVVRYTSENGIEFAHDDGQ